ncbi:efflux RND transporter periplasmic adaptor subunit [Ensifer sp. SSB1]|uniref:efflux RND transporter periplasmic adaptor subunit n=1 Tax=Ensifer sp. SSB1 TaxID=2795385 RepID=UPI001A37B317|nr:efflux RND transporter periplasmic adaptor subunit [Ensifer sp. SSB1]MBK5567908.1 efflux RND transporter periplasmic adaptor subunit [Ensifer sp. SSB1]
MITSLKRSLLIAAVLVPVAALVVLKAYGRTNEAPAEGPVGPQASLTVSVEKVRTEPSATFVTATGSIGAWQEATIGAEASGLRLADVLVEEGDHVESGEIVARLDSALLKAQLAEQRAAVEQARATLESAQSASVRAQKLLVSKAISVESAEEKSTTFKTSRAQLAQAEAAAERKEAELAQTEIRAPFDGVVSERPAVVGAIVQTGTELLKIIRDGRVEVAVQVPEKNLQSVAVGQAATVTDASGRVTQGSVSSVAEKVDATTRLGTVRVSLSNGSGLKPGMFARVSIETAVSRMPSVAESALIWRDGMPSVFIVEDDGKVTARAIETGTRSGGRVTVTSGLEGGESVVIAGAGFLSDGNTVRVSPIEAGNTSNTASNETFK